MQKKIPGKIIASVAASATPLVAADAVADNHSPGQEMIDYRINVAFEGGAFRTNRDDKSGGLDKFGDNDSAAYGSVAISRKYDTDLDWRLSATLHFAEDSDFNYEIFSPPQANPFSLRASSDFNYQTVDFDLGKHVKFQGHDVRLFAGLRGIHARETLDWYGSITPVNPAVDKSGTFDKMGSSSYWGIGPRIGADAYHGIGDNWGLIGSVSAAAMWGRRSSDFSFNSAITDPPDPLEVNSAYVDQDSNEVVTNFEAKIGAKWYFTPDKSISAGYRYETWDNLQGFNGDDDNYSAHGVFLGVGVKY